MSKPTLPIVHSNGTSARELTEGYAKASCAISDALNSIRLIEFNARDYYPQDGAWQLARAEMEARVEALREIQNDFDAIAQHCANFIKA